MGLSSVATRVRVRYHLNSGSREQANAASIIFTGEDAVQQAAEYVQRREVTVASQGSPMTSTLAIFEQGGLPDPRDNGWRWTIEDMETE